MEIWKEIPGFEDYEISSLCRVRSKLSGRVLKCHPATNQYIRVTLYNKKVPKTMLIHRLMYSSFKGPIPKNLHIAHLDGTRDNNLIDNLMLATIEENCSHKILHGTDLHGEKSPNAKLNSEKVRFIRDNPSIHTEELAKKYGVTRVAVSNARRMKTWIYV